jgi:hypothetical protein
MVAANNGSVALARFAAEAGDHGAGPSQVHSSCKIPFGESRNPMSESGHDRNGVSKPYVRFRRVQTWSTRAYALLVYAA